MSRGGAGMCPLLVSTRTQAALQTATLAVVSTALACGAVEGAVPETTDNRIDAEVGLWIASLQEAMGPTACGAIDCAAETCEVKVRWNDSRATDGEETHELVTETRL